MALKMGGRFVLRIEDIDIGRCREEYVEAIFEDLDWLGIAWDGPVRRQSEHFDTYRGAARELADLGLLYPCFASRRQIAEAATQARLGTDPEGQRLYPGIWRGANPAAISKAEDAGLASAMRVDMARALEALATRLNGEELSFMELGSAGLERVRAWPARWGDAVITRKDVPTSYHLAVVVDDAAQGVTHVTRGRDLFCSTDIHRLLQVLIGLPEPIYRHHHVILDATGRKLSKSEMSTGLRELRASGRAAGDVLAELDHLLPDDLRKPP